MITKLPAPIATYIAVGNGGDTKALAECFAESAVVRDEGQTIKGLIAIKQWMAETKRKYQHTIEPIALGLNDMQGAFSACRIQREAQRATTIASPDRHRFHCAPANRRRLPCATDKSALLSPSRMPRR